MPLSNSNVRDVYNGNGIATSYPYTAKIYSADQLSVTVGGVVQAYMSDYDLTGIGSDNGGNVLFYSAPGSGTKNIIVERLLTYARDQDYQSAGQFREDVLDRDIDERVMQIQQLAADLELSLKLPSTESGSSFNTTFPAPDPGKYVRCKTDATGFEYVNITVDSGTLITTTWAENWLQLSSSASALTELGIDAPSTTVAGIWEAATDAETIAGTDTNRTTTPSNLFAYAKAVVQTAGTEPDYTATHTHCKIDAVTATGAAVTINTLALKFVTGEDVRDFHLAVGDIVHFVVDGTTAYWLNPPNRPIDLSSYAGADYAMRVGESVKRSFTGVSSVDLKVAMSDGQAYNISGYYGWGAANRTLALVRNGVFTVDDFSRSFNGDSTTTKSAALLLITDARIMQGNGDLRVGSATTAELTKYSGVYGVDNGTNVFSGSGGGSIITPYTTVTSMKLGILDAYNSTAFSATTFVSSYFTITRTA
jgi:hypothetical protein